MKDSYPSEDLLFVKVAVEVAVELKFLSNEQGMKILKKKEQDDHKHKIWAYAKDENILSGKQVVEISKRIKEIEEENLRIQKEEHRKKEEKKIPEKPKNNDKEEIKKRENPETKCPPPKIGLVKHTICQNCKMSFRLPPNPEPQMECPLCKEITKTSFENKEFKGFEVDFYLFFRIGSIVLPIIILILPIFDNFLYRFILSVLFGGLLYSFSVPTQEDENVSKSTLGSDSKEITLGAIERFQNGDKSVSNLVKVVDDEKASFEARQDATIRLMMKSDGSIKGASQVYDEEKKKN